MGYSRHQQQQQNLYSLAEAVCMVIHVAGIGGVHRGGESSMDISADLIELGKTPMAGVSAKLQRYW